MEEVTEKEFGYELRSMETRAPELRSGCAQLMISWAELSADSSALEPASDSLSLFLPHPCCSLSLSLSSISKH